MPTATLTTKGQITIPKKIRDHLGVDAGDRLSFEVKESGAVIVHPETTDLRSLRGVLRRNPDQVARSSDTRLRAEESPAVRYAIDSHYDRDHSGQVFDDVHGGPHSMGAHRPTDRTAPCW